MDLLLLFTAATAAVAAPVERQARATVRILAPERISEQEWRAARHRTDRIVRDESGQTIRLRLIEFE